MLAKSDCIYTSLTITADITDDTQVDRTTLRYRVGTDQKFISTKMIVNDRNQYTATVFALDVPGGEYGGSLSSTSLYRIRREMKPKVP